MNNRHEIETQIRERLEIIRSVPPRNPQAAGRARARFIAQAVSAKEFQRHKGWKSIFRKERFAMNMLIAVLAMAALLAGGTATVNAAQDDLPNEPLYALKTWSEDISLQFQPGPEKEVDRLMELAQVRLQEMSTLTEAGQTPPDRVRRRLEQHLHQALQLCSNMDETALDRTLQRVRDRLQQQDRDMQRLQIHASQNSLPILERTRTMLRQQLQLVDEGLLNHEQFRNRIRGGYRFGQPPAITVTPTYTPLAPGGGQNGPMTPQPGPANGNGPGPNPDPGGPSPERTPIHNRGGNGGGTDGTGGNGSGNQESNGGNGSGEMNGGGNGGGGNNTGGGGGNRP